ncbi:MAG: hypothetical protein AAGD11_13305 [Planctomycetota bacterium]
MKLPRKRQLRRFLRQATTLATLAAVAICAVGVSLPLRVDDGDEFKEQTPFPCMNRPCGCKTAAQCWKQCCCFSHQEKLAWARKHGVTPPDFVVVAAAHQASSCCQSIENHTRSTEVASCCAVRPSSTCCVTDSHVKRPPRRAKTSSTVMLIESLKCQGISYSLSLLPPTVVPSRDAILFDLPIAGSIATISDLLPADHCSAPDTPPPESLS